MMLSISIIIPVHNRKSLTQNILAELHQQTLDIDLAKITIRPLAKKIYAIIKNFHFQTKSVNS